MIELSEQASNAMLDTLGNMLGGGSIELLAEENDRVLAVLRLSDPATFEASDGELKFREIAEEDSALAQGTVSTARITDANGGTVFLCTVGDFKSDAVIKLNTTKIYAGGPVGLQSFRLAMP